MQYSDQDRKEIEQFLEQSLEELSKDEYPAKHREHLGASIIGEECSRLLWYNFRWVKLNEFSGRMRRLFNRGHREEEVLINILFKLGFFIREIDPATDKQYKFSAINGHFGGSGDSIALFPWDKGENGERILVEYKTHNAKYFKELKEKKLKLAQPKHYAQMCSYGLAFKIYNGLYIAVNKDNDEVHFEFLELDWRYGEQLLKKAEDIIYTEFPPNRISDNAAYFKCKFCHFQGICHYGEQVEKNCRSCKNAIPVENGEWYCAIYHEILPKDFIEKGCDSHMSING